MMCSLLCLGAILTSQTSYEPGKHAAFLEQRFESTRNTIRNLETKKIEMRVAVERLGATLGECRRLQSGLTEWMQKQTGQNTRAIRLIQTHGLFEAYLTSEILAIDGDAESKSLVKVLEMRLSKLVPNLTK